MVCVENRAIHAVIGKTTVIHAIMIFARVGFKFATALAGIVGAIIGMIGEGCMK